MKKLLQFLMTVILIFSGLWFSSESQASETSPSDTVQIELYKLLFETDTLPTETINDGSTNPFDFPGSTFLKKYRGLNGVTYSAFDVTDDFYQLLKAQKSTVEAQQILASQEMTARPALQTVTTETVNNQAGVALFKLPAFDGQNRYRAYLFKEVSTSPYYEAPAAPLVVILPVTKKDGSPLDVIRLFPKQLGRTYTPPTLTKDSSKKITSYGEVIHYHLTSKVPGDVWKYKKYSIKDKADQRLSLHQDSLKISVKGQELDPDLVTINFTESGFELKFKPMEMQQYATEELTIDYDMHLKAGAEADTDFINTASLETDKDFIERDKKVKTGGFRFVKVDRKNQEKVLAGASFIIKNKAGMYLKQVGDKYEWVSETSDELANYEKAGLLTLVSNQKGIFEITGLTHGNYELVEVKAPKGYVLSQVGIPFEVAEGTWQLKNLLAEPLRVINEAQEETPPPTRPMKPWLPKTGEVVSLASWFGVVIIVIAAISYIRVTKSKSSQEKGE